MVPLHRRRWPPTKNRCKSSYDNSHADGSFQNNFTEMFLSWPCTKIAIPVQDHFPSLHSRDYQPISAVSSNYKTVPIIKIEGSCHSLALNRHQIDDLPCYYIIIQVSDLGPPWTSSYFSMKTCCGTHYNGLSEMLLMSSHNISFLAEIRKYYVTTPSYQELYMKYQFLSDRIYKF